VPDVILEAAKLGITLAFNVPLPDMMFAKSLALLIL